MSGRIKPKKLTLKTILFRVLFGRTSIVILILAAEIALIIFGLKLVIPYLTYIYGIISLLSFLCLVHEISGNDLPEFKMSWAFVLIIPVVGVLIYILLKFQMLTRRVRKRNKRLDSGYNKSGTAPPDGVSLYLEKTGYPTFDDTRVVYFPSGEAMFGEMLRELENAKEFIFLEFYIVAEGYMWDTVITLLERKKNEGVDVRIMYDAIGSIGRLPSQTMDDLNVLGIKCREFARIYPFISTIHNNRDHRKLVIIDGVTGFTGGINIADEYINVQKRNGNHWKDAGIMLKGSAVSKMTHMFLSNWWLYEQGIEDFTPFIKRLPGTGKIEGHAVMFGDSPFDDEDIGKRVYVDMISGAKKYVHIMTPYLIIDHEITEQLCFAAGRGVEVSLIMPYKSDSWISREVGHTYYKKLVGAGVSLYEYLPGMIHSKSCVSDGERAVVGTINMDYRSFYLHFECACYFRDMDVVNDVEDDFIKTIKISKKINMEDVESISLPHRFAGKVIRLIAPLL